jgi:hypothetical protein
MPATTTILESHERCRKFEEECRREGRRSEEECRRQRRRCETVCGYM